MQGGEPEEGVGGDDYYNGEEEVRAEKGRRTSGGEARLSAILAVMEAIMVEVEVFVVQAKESSPPP